MARHRRDGEGEGKLTAAGRGQRKSPKPNTPPPVKVDLNAAKCSLARLKLAIKYEQKTVGRLGWHLFECL